MASSRTGRAHLWRRAEEYVCQAAAQSETENSGHALELVLEATRLPEGGAEVEAQDRMQWETGSLVGA